MIFLASCHIIVMVNFMCPLDREMRFLGIWLYAVSGMFWNVVVFEVLNWVGRWVGTIQSSISLSRTDKWRTKEFTPDLLWVLLSSGLFVLRPSDSIYTIDSLSLRLMHQIYAIDLCHWTFWVSGLKGGMLQNFSPNIITWSNHSMVSLFLVNQYTNWKAKIVTWFQTRERLNCLNWKRKQLCAVWQDEEICTILL